VPKFSVARSSNGQSLQSDNPTFFTSAAWGIPELNKGGWTWSGGVLTVPKTGVYMVVATMKLVPTDSYRQYVGVTRNVSEASSSRATGRRTSPTQSDRRSRLHGFTASRLPGSW